jgi:hypothetical protein
MRHLGIPTLVLMLLAGCGGSGGSDPAPGGGAEFLTADTLGIARSVDPGLGAPAPPVDAGGPEAASGDGREAIAREIAQADLYRVDGDLLYLLNAYRGLAIVDLPDYELVGRLAVPGVPLEMYLRGSRAFVFVTDFETGTRLVEISVANPLAPAVARTEILSEGYRTSRVVGDVLYAVTDTAVHSFALGPAPFALVASLELPPGAQFAQATDALAFIAGPVTVDDGAVNTRVTLVDISDPAGALALRGAIELPGYVGDDQKLGFGGGVLRVVTHDWTDGGRSRLFTVDVADPDAPALLATLELARGEQLFATRFTDDRAYIVTFQSVDPLWVIDLADPAHPVIAGELVIPGFSTQIVADGDRLVALGVDTTSWNTVVSLFDVANPAAPQLLDQVDLGASGSEALAERKAFGVFPGRVLVPFWDRLAVVDHDPAGLNLRGSIPVAGGALRGFPHAAGLVAAGAEEVVIADPDSLDVRGRVTVAENVVDVARLADGRLLNLVQAGDRTRVGGAELALWAEALYAFGNRAAVLGWDDSGRAAYVISFEEAEPAISARLELGWGDAWTGMGGGLGPRDMASGGVGIIGPVFGGGPQAVLTDSGKLVVRGRPGDTPRVFGEGNAFDGLLVIDIPGAALGTGVEIRGGAVTGFTADGSALAFTFAEYAGTDDGDRPLVRQHFVRVDLDTGEASAPANVPGYVVAARGADAYTVEEQWGEDWSLTIDVVSSTVADGEASVLDRLALPANVYDLRATGATLLYTIGGDLAVPVLGKGDPSAPWLPSSAIGTVRLGPSLADGPTIEGSDAFRWLLLAEENTALVMRAALTIECWDISAAEATLSWSAALAGYPLRAHADPATAGRYLVALGYAGAVELP